MLGWSFKLRLGRVKKRRGLGPTAAAGHGSGSDGRRHQTTPQERYRTRARQQLLLEKHHELQRSPKRRRNKLYQQRSQDNTAPRKVGGRTLRPPVLPHLQLPNGKVKSHSLRVDAAGGGWRRPPPPASWLPLRTDAPPRIPYHVVEARLRAHRHQLWRQQGTCSACVASRRPRAASMPRLGGERFDEGPPRTEGKGRVLVLGGKAVSVGSRPQPRALSWHGEERQVEAETWSPSQPAAHRSRTLRVPGAPHGLSQPRTHTQTWPRFQ